MAHILCIQSGKHYAAALNIIRIFVLGCAYLYIILTYKELPLIAEGDYSMCLCAKHREFLIMSPACDIEGR